MAIVRSLSLKPLNVRSKHKEVDCTYSVVEGEEGELCLQIDTYGSEERQIPGKKSQSLRFTSSSVAELREIIDRHFPRFK